MHILLSTIILEVWKMKTNTQLSWMSPESLQSKGIENKEWKLKRVMSVCIVS